ncbi:hypothetical protein PROFUN_11643 [Planoprotostelium fungivorum]|uniref:Presenilin n=1 Tax=Planoprotostelium fungivorum TaxID=1890364 RepID=A0A2P6N9P6_9EUKA|nr:hypothetical protein PROFUN_11643 [Planoprotostelium fungivorum]
MSHSIDGGELEEIEPQSTTEQRRLLDEDRLLQTRTSEQQTSHHQQDDDDEDEDNLEYQSETILTILKPVSLTMIFVIWAVKTISISAVFGGGSAIYMVYAETSTDSNAMKFGGAILNAILFVGMIVVVTVIFVVLYKYRCYKILYGWLILSCIMMFGLFGGTLAYYMLIAYNLPLDWLTFSFCLWNFAVVGVLTVFWHGPTKINQAYLILIGGLMAIFFTRLPEWTTFSILVVIALYDLVAVLCPKGPLRVLVNLAQERKEPIPALLYNASVFTMMADKEVQMPEENKRKGVKLGLGDFVFYSVLIGRAAMFNMITVFTCFFAIITGLFCTLLLLAIFRKALPALPISIALGILFYFATSFFLYPFVVQLSFNPIFI